YDYIYSFITFNLTLATDHPRKNICAGSYCSTAAGRYQFLSKTWDMVQGVLRLPDFKQTSQDKAGIYLVENRKVSKSTHRSIMDYTTFQQTMNKISYEWASLPPGRYGQPIKSMSVSWAKYKEFTQ
ncbi:hypothetical protein MEO40_19310, partial [Dolichospermum sp. ST_sed1]|nr:hypothetical protein [Dolichospermum sp. ST_sed1]